MLYSLTNGQPEEMEKATFSSLHMKESDLEEILRENVVMIAGEDESLLIVGEQVENVARGRCDLMALDSDGNLVLIEIKRDKEDAKQRKETFESQAIRYAASCATIQNTDELLQKAFIPYVERYSAEFSSDENLPPAERASQILGDFVSRCGIKEFNRRQRIILVASGFDDQTLSAVAWLCDNSLDISCIQLSPYRDERGIFLEVEKILPVPDSSEFYVEMKLPGAPQTTVTRRSRQNLPRIDDMISWGVVAPGDILVAKDYPDEKAKLLSSGKVSVGEKELSVLQWLKGIYPWSNLSIYTYTKQEKTGKLLWDIRKEYMDAHPEEE